MNFEETVLKAKDLLRGTVILPRDEHLEIAFCHADLRYDLEVALGAFEELRASIAAFEEEAASCSSDEEVSFEDRKESLKRDFCALIDQI